MPLILRRGGESQGRGPIGCGGGMGRIAIALLVACFAVGSYYCTSQQNPITGQNQHISMSPSDDVKMGLMSEPEMVNQMGGESRDGRGQETVKAMGAQLLQHVPNLGNAPYQWDFHLLADPQTVNAFALPGGPVFITEALFSKLDTPGQLAGVLGHEIGHVIHRHGAEHMAKQQLLQGLTGAALIATYDPNNPNGQQSAAIVQMVGQFINLRYGRQDELESDEMGVELMTRAGYNPESMVRVMEVLKKTGGGGRAPEWASSHPDPDNRIARIREAIKKKFPDGVPKDLKD